MNASDLFMRRSAQITPCTLYRVWLEREWEKGEPTPVVCMLNVGAYGMVNSGFDLPLQREISDTREVLVGEASQ